MKNSGKVPQSTIHSSENLKNRASDLGKDLTKHITEESVSEVKNDIKETNDKDEFTGWDFGKRFWGLTPASGGSDKKDLDKTKPKESTSKEKVFDDNKLKIKKDPPKTTIKKTEKENLKIKMNDFKVSEKEEKIGKFERVRSITSALNEEVSSEELKSFQDFLNDDSNIEEEEIDFDNEFKKITSKAELFRSDETTKSLERNVVFGKKKVNAQKDIKLNRAEAVRKHRRESRKSTAAKFLTITIIFIVLVVIIYLYLKDSSSTENSLETLQPITRIDNATYIERTYDIPVTYPYSKPETEVQVIGFLSTDSKEEKSEKIIEDKTPPEKKLITKPTVKKEIVVTKPKVNFPVKKPSGNHVQAAYNIFKYEDIYIVQVAAFRKKNSAEKVASKYIAKGYNAFLEEAIINGVTWHRVRVGNFDTLEKAKQFRKSNN
jgi:hypothetical protein